MLRILVTVGCLLGVIGGCAHKGAIRVQCDGVLRPINSPQTPWPVSVIPAAPLKDDGVPHS